MPERTGATPARMELAERVAELRRRGLKHREVAAALGISRGYASSLAGDPDGSRDRARKDSYGGNCLICGAATTGSMGRVKAPLYCLEHAAEAYRHWSRAKIIAAMWLYAARFDRQPTATDYVGRFESTAPKFSGRRLREIDEVEKAGLALVPNTVRFYFGTWTAALEAAGFDPSPGGRPSHRRRRIPQLQDIPERSLLEVASPTEGTGS